MVVVARNTSVTIAVRSASQSGWIDVGKKATSIRLGEIRKGFGFERMGCVRDWGDTESGAEKFTDNRFGSSRYVAKRRG